MKEIVFKKWSGPNNFIIQTTGCKPFSGAGINPRVDKKTTILRSVDRTYYYDDDMSDPDNIEYTLFGHNGDQYEKEKMFNEPLLNKDKTQHIYVYRVNPDNKSGKYIWYGKYEIVDKNTKMHQGKDHVNRKIIRLS